MATWNQYGFQDRANSLTEELVYFHDFVLIILIFILTLVGYAIVTTFYSPYINKSLLDGQVIETIWTIVPALILVQIAIPSLWLLYLLDEPHSWPNLSLKVIGHQWYWSYEYNAPYLDQSERTISFDSYIIPTEERNDGVARLLDVDNRLVFVYDIEVRALVTSADVLHSWAVPSLGVKVDACPGRLNQTRVLRRIPGVFFGQCSEICGANHRFMPIALEFVNRRTYALWCIRQID